MVNDVVRPSSVVHFGIYYGYSFCVEQKLFHCFRINTLYMFVRHCLLASWRRWTCLATGRAAALVVASPTLLSNRQRTYFACRVHFVQGIDVVWTSNLWFAVVRLWPQSFAELVSLRLCLRRWPGPFCFLRNLEPLHVALCSRVIVVWLFVPIRGIQQVLQCAMSLTQNYNER